MPRPLQIFDLLFSSGRERWNNNLLAKLGLGCVSALCLVCFCSGCFILWLLISSDKPVDIPDNPIFIQPNYDLLVFQPDTLPPAQAGQEYSAKIAISKNVTPVGDFYLSDGELPAGITLEQIVGEDTAILSGIPEQAGTYTFIVSVWCYGTNVSGQTGEKEYTIVVEE